jgi:MFS family permease
MLIDHSGQGSKMTAIRQRSLEKAPTTGETVMSSKLSMRERWASPIVIASLFLGTLLIALDTTIIGTAIPAITTSFHTLEDLAWYGSGYLLTVTALQPSFGKLYKLLNIKGVYIACIFIFESIVFTPGAVLFMQEVAVKLNSGICAFRRCALFLCLYCRSSYSWVWRCWAATRCTSSYYTIGPT